MALFPLAEVSDLAAWVGQAIPDSDPRAGAVLSAASALVRSYAGVTWEGVAAPEDVSAVVVQVASRVWLNPNGVVSVTLDDGSLRWSEASAAGLYLTDADKAVLSSYQTQGADSFGLGTVSMAGGSTVNDTTYVPTGPPPSGYPFPWYSTEGF